MLSRRADWEARLHQFLLASFARPFAYGEMDCCLWVADAVEAMTGFDLAAPFRGRYGSELEAVALADEYAGHPRIAALVEKRLKECGLREIPHAFAQRGDIALINRGCAGLRSSLGLISLDGRYILAAAETGFVRVDVRRSRLAWRV